MLLRVLVLVSLMVSAVGAVDNKKLSREQFNLMGDTISELDELATRFDTLRAKLRKQHEQMKELLPDEQEGIVPEPAPLDISIHESHSKPQEQVLPYGYMLVFTAEWCDTCVKIVKPAMGELKASGWIQADYVEGGAKGHLKIVDWDKYRQLTSEQIMEKFHLKESIKTLPTFVKLESLKVGSELSPAEVWRYEGPLNSKQIAELYIGKTQRSQSKKAQ